MLWKYGFIMLGAPLYIVEVNIFKYLKLFEKRVPIPDLQVPTPPHFWRVIPVPFIKRAGTGFRKMYLLRGRYGFLWVPAPYPPHYIFI